MASNPVRFGMLSFAHIHADSYAHSIVGNPNTELIGIADTKTERAESKSAHFGTAAYSSYEELLSQKNLDAVVICCENARHRKLVEMAASAGKHILCEKPLATSVEDGEAMISACRKAGVQLMTSLPCRYSPVMKRLKERIDQGDAGEILAFRGTNRGSNPGGWFQNPAESGGGATMDHTVHVVDLMRWLLKDEVREVYAEINNGISHQEFDDISFLSLTFQRGVFATLDASWSRPRSFPTWGDVTLEVITSKGTLSMDMFSQNLTLYSDKQNRVSWHNWGGDMDAGMIAAFAEAVQKGTPVPISGEDGLRAAEVAFAAYRSAKSGSPISLPIST